MRPTVAICRHAASDDREAMSLALECCAPAGIEVTAYPFALDIAAASAAAIRALSAGELDCRFHFPLGTHELTHVSKADAAAGLEHMMQLVQLMEGAGERYLTVHAPLPADARGTLRESEAIARLRELVGFAAVRGVTVCLENLRWGLTSEPDAFVRMADESGASVTFDVGHAVSSDTATCGYRPERFVRDLGNRIVGAHVYGHEHETEGHHPPRDITCIQPVLDALCDVSCGWWTIELLDHQQIRTTRTMLDEYLNVTYPADSPLPV